MNKLAQYLNQHLQGEVFVDKDTLRHFASDSSPLQQEPEMVVFSFETNDIRKLLRFSWQLAEKGHRLPVTARGAGLNGTGAAISSGVVIAMNAHMNRIFEYDSKQRLVRLQPGVSTGEANNALRLQGTSIPVLGEGRQTVGGVLADRNGTFTAETVEQLEIVLANGDVLQTKRLSKRELSKVKGQQSFEADIYREVDGLIDESAEIIEQLDRRDASGYGMLGDVKHKDGSLDLTPLFLGTQGTLGVISELILKAEYVSETTSVVVAAFDSPVGARDALDGAAKVDVASMEYFGAELIARAKAQGKVYSFIGDAEQAPTLLVARVNDMSGRVQARKIKKLRKHFEKCGAIVSTTDNFEESEFKSLDGILSLAAQDDTKESQIVVDRAYVPLGRSEDFMSGLTELSKKMKLDLPLYGRPLDSLWTVRPMVAMGSVGGKQSLLKFVSQYGELVNSCGGYLAGMYSEGRLPLAASKEKEQIQALFAKLKKIFDPYDILNTGAKQPADVKELAKSLRSDSAPRIPGSSS
jgi:FAD/FMN-containing dehydrogenase